MITQIIPDFIWIGTAIFSLFFGGIMIFFYLYSALGSSVDHHGDTADHSDSFGHHLDNGMMDHGDAGGLGEHYSEIIHENTLDLHHDLTGDLDHGLHEHIHGHIDSSHDTLSTNHSLPDLEHELNGSSHISSNEFSGNIESIDVPDTVIVEGGKIIVPSISGGLFLYGISGTLLWVGSKPNDVTVLFSIFIGFIGGFLMSKVMGYLTRGYMVPVSGIQRGNIAIVLFEVTPTKTGLVSVKQTDGTSRKAMAIGAFPHDFFDRGERALVWDASSHIIKITKDISPSEPFSLREVEKNSSAKNKSRMSFGKDKR